MYKSKLRLQIKNKLKQLSEDERNDIETKLYLHLFSTHKFKNASIIGTTFSQSFEWDTSTIMKKAWENGKTIVVPKTYPIARELHFYKIEPDSELKEGFGNILEPNEETCEKVAKHEIDLLIVPGIVFDEYGYRIGFGGGYYDRFLTDFHQTTLSIASKQQFIDRIPVQTYDIPVDFLVTEEGCFLSKI